MWNDAASGSLIALPNGILVYGNYQQVVLINELLESAFAL